MSLRTPCPPECARAPGSNRWPGSAVAAGRKAGACRDSARALGTGRHGTGRAGGATLCRSGNMHLWVDRNMGSCQYGTVGRIPRPTNLKGMDMDYLMQLPLSAQLALTSGVFFFLGFVQIAGAKRRARTQAQNKRLEVQATKLDELLLLTRQTVVAITKTRDELIDLSVKPLANGHLTRGIEANT